MLSNRRLALFALLIIALAITLRYIWQPAIPHRDLIEHALSAIGFIPLLYCAHQRFLPSNHQEALTYAVFCYLAGSLIHEVRQATEVGYRVYTQRHIPLQLDQLIADAMGCLIIWVLLQQNRKRRNAD